MGLSGAEAEERACTLLKGQGYKIVARNWRSRYGEIDIVARDGSTIVFVEVKARSGDGFGGAGAAVDLRKQRRIASTAGQFLQETGCEFPARFDVVTFSKERPRLHRDAFRMG
ncbi:MAG: YraN family protein [Candidatus Bipolaricaulia bacterium]